MVLFEETKRIDDYTVFTFPRVVEGVWFFFKKKYNLNDIPNFSRIIFAVSLAIIFYLKKFYPKEIPAHYVRQFNFFFGN